MNTKRWSIAALVVCMLMIGGTFAEEATLIVYNGKIVTVDQKNTIVEAMALRDDMIVALGKNEDVLKLAGPTTHKLDMNGRMVMPGMVDPHWHLANHMDEDFPEFKRLRILPTSTDKAKTKAEIEAAIAARVKELKPGQWIIASPVSFVAKEMVVFEEITVADLDRVAPNNPVMMQPEAGIGSQIMINTKARQLAEKEFAGLKRFTDSDLKAVGTDFSPTIVKDVAMKGREEDYARSMKKYLIQTVPKSGVTTAGTIITKVPLDAMGILDRKGELPMRFGWIYGYAAYYDPEGFYKRLPNLAGIGSKYLFNMGVGEELTDSPATGLCTTLPPIDKDMQARLAKMKIDTCFLSHPARRATVKDQIQYNRPVEYHNGGDKSIDLMLEIIDEIRRETGMTVEQVRAKRLTLEHAIMIRPDQIPKLKDYGIIMTLASGHMNNQLDPTWPSNLRKNFGTEYIRWHQPVADLLKGGVNTILAEFGGRGFEAIRMFTTREACFTPQLPTQGEVGVKKCEVLVPGQVVTDRLTMLKMVTTGPAYYSMKEKEVGSLEVGKYGDFAVIDRDFFTVPEKEIGDLKVLMTVLGGKVVFADAAFGAVDKALFKSPEYVGKAVLAN